MVYNSDQEAKMKQIAISEFKAKCLVLLEQVRRTRQPIRITRHGKPVAEVVPPTVVMDRDAWVGSMKGSFKIIGDILEPATDEQEWEALRD
jgi:prevent-host-death family protein